MANSSMEMAIFQRVAERGSFAGAAEDAGLSPSAVAKLISRLEGRLHSREERAKVGTGPRAVDLYFPSNTRVGGSISLLKASAVLANPRCTSVPS